MQKGMEKKILGIPKAYLGVVAVLAAIMMSVIDGTVMNVALPTLSDHFGASPSQITWVVNAYQLVITVSLLSFASLGDIHGYRRVFLFGVAVFGLASLACALADSLWTLVGARVVQGIGAAAVMSVNTALIRLIYPPEYLGRGLGINAMVVSVSVAAGPSLAGAILSVASWHWLFVINIPIAAIAFFTGRAFLPQNPVRERSYRFDKISAVANALTFGLLIYTLEGFAHDESRRLIAVQVVLLLAIGYFFIRRQRTLQAPILPVDLLKIPIFSLSIGTSVCSFTAQMLAMVSLPFLLEGVLGRSVAETGLLLTPWPLVTIVAAPLAGRLVEKIHPGLLGSVGMAVFALGLFLLAELPAQPENSQIIWRMAVCGAGFGLFQTPNNVTIVSSAPTSRSGGASGMQGTARLFGQTLGTTLVALIFRVAAPDVSPMRCLMVAIGFALTAAVVSSLRLSQATPVKKRG